MLSDLLIHKVEVYRRSGRTDRLGQATDANPSQVTIGQPTATYPARLTRGRGGLSMVERSVDVFETRYVLYTEMVDIVESDAVRVLDEAGAELLPISKISNKSAAADSFGGHHLEIEVWSQRGPR